MELNGTFIKELCRVNSFPLPTEPLILFFRNTDVDGGYMADTGDNCCDLVSVLMNADITIGRGRSLTHKKYQARMVSGEERANRIASSFTGKAWRRGNHRGYPALVQNVKFIIWRSTDMLLGDADDYTEYDKIGDNCHGWAPLSQGCATIEGNMGNPWNKSTGDWLKFVSRIYESTYTFYDAAIMEYEDWQLRRRIRPGSYGSEVMKWQRKLGIQEDGDFGPIMMDAVRKFQRAEGMIDNGILELEGV